MAMTMNVTPCSACGELPNPAARWEREADCLATHDVHTMYAIYELAHVLVHCWKDDREYSAVKRWRTPFSDEDALAWLARCHAGEVARRPIQEALQIVFDVWED